MRNLDIADSRAKLEQYAGLGMVGAQHAALIGTGQTELIGQMPEGGAEAIASRGTSSSELDEALDRAAMEFGVD
jgi:argininosuccinate synthase